MYKVQFTESAIKQLKKLDKQTTKVIKNLVHALDSLQHGKSLKGNLSGIWRYRVGEYRMFATIKNEVNVIKIFEIVHRRSIYKR